MTRNENQAVCDHVMTDAQILFFVLSRDGKILTANAFARSLTRCEPKKTHFQDLVVDFSGKFCLSEMLTVSTRPQLLNITLSCGKPQSFLFHFTSVENRIMAFGRLDITEIDAIQEQVLSLNRDLNDLTRRLHKKNAQLQQLNAEKNQFLGMAAHDLRKPIGLIMAYTEFLQDEAAPALTSEQQTFLSSTHAAALFMKKLVDDFLDISAIEAGRFDLNPGPVLVSELLHRSLAVNRIQAQKKGVRIDVEITSPHEPVIMDGPKIEQAVTNLVANAVDHSRPGQTVAITCFSSEKEIVFQVKDNGPGMDSREQARLFTPFATAGARKTGGEKSTGLGMVITRKIIAAHQGTIQVDSAPEKGTIITFRFPEKRQGVKKI
jgi:signal transduction histidine kinase